MARIAESLFVKFGFVDQKSVGFAGFHHQRSPASTNNLAGDPNLEMTMSETFMNFGNQSRQSGLQGRRRCLRSGASVRCETAHGDPPNRIHTNHALSDWISQALSNLPGKTPLDLDFLEFLADNRGIK
jgi:hypothetical protein